MGAVLACGPDAVLSHRSAAELWRMLPIESRRGPLVIRQSSTSPFPARASTEPGIRVHRSTTLSPGRSARSARHPGDQARAHARGSPAHFPQTGFRGGPPAGRVPPAPDRPRVVADHTRSELEARFLALVRRHRLPQPEVNARVDRFVVDFLWRARAAHRRGRRLGIARDPIRVRGRPGPRRSPQAARLRRPALHLAAGRETTAPDVARAIRGAAPRGRVSRSALRFRLGPNLGWLDGFDRGGSNLPG